VKKNDSVKQFLIILFFIILCLIIVIPLIVVISVSLSSEKDIAVNGYCLFPRLFDLSAYRYVFLNQTEIINAYKVTFIFSMLTMILAVLLMSMIAYPLSRSNFKSKRFVAFYLYFTTLFGGGLVPSYILITQYLHLNDTIWVYIIPYLITPWYIFMIRTFFQNIPNEIIESMLIDGAIEYTIYYKIMLPLSKPVLATVALFVFLGKWNDWMTSMLYINQDKYISLQYLLQRIMKNIELLRDTNSGTVQMMASMDIPAETVRMAMAVVVAGPVLVIFPFFQKYFTKGLTVGSVKG